DGVEEPGVDARELVDTLHGHAALERLGYGEDAQRRSVRERVLQVLKLEGLRVEPPYPDVQHAQRLLDDPGEGAADGHYLADALHLGGDAHGGAAELGQVPARDFAHQVVERGLEEGGGAAGDSVGNLWQGVT